MISELTVMRHLKGFSSRRAWNKSKSRAALPGYKNKLVQGEKPR